MRKHEKLIAIFLFILICILTIFAIITKDYKLLIAMWILTVVLICMFSLIFALDNEDKIMISKEKRYYRKLKSKENNTIYECLFMTAFQKKLVLCLKEALKLRNIKSINELYVCIYNLKKIRISFNYQGYYIVMFIYDNKIIYQIDTPEIYDNLDTNKAFEKKRIINVNLDGNGDLNSFMELFSSIILDVQNEVHTFTNANVPDSFFNGKLVNKFTSSSSYLKVEGIASTIFSLFLSIVFTYVLYISINDYKTKLENESKYYAGIVICILIIAAGVCVLIYGLNYIFKYINMMQDVKLKRLSKINGPLKRVRIIYDQPGRNSNVRTLRYIKLYYKNLTLLIPFKLPETFVHIDKRALYEELLSIKTEVKYLTKSRLVISGGSRFISIVRKYIR